MSYRWIDHTAELELQIEGPTEAAIFRHALEAMAELLGDTERASAAETVTFDVTLDAPDRGALLVDWIDELVYRAETAGLVPAAAEPLELHGTRLTATVRAHPATPRHVVKGATYHRLTFEPITGGVRAGVVLDV